VDALAAATEDSVLIALENTLDAVDDGRRRLQPFVERQGLGAMAVNRIEVIFEELVANIVRHGFSAGSGQSIRVRATALPGAVELVFEDDGAPFDPFQAPAPKPFTTLEEASLGGLGVQLVVRLSVARRYERLDAGGRQDGFNPVNRVTVLVSTAAGAGAS
jgi:anti-sigma regulatory factor (Ser/Thr protein kinase)